MEETGDGTAVFEGTVEYTMLNQLNVDDSGTHTGITTLSDELAIILNDGYTGTRRTDSHIRRRSRETGRTNIHGRGQL